MAACAISHLRVGFPNDGSGTLIVDVSCVVPESVESEVGNGQPSAP